MAVADCAISVGFRSSAEPGTTASASCYTVVGFASAAAPVAWSGNQGSRRVADWLPRIDEAFGTVRDGKVYINVRWWNLLREVCDRLGGVQGPSITQVVSTVEQTQVQVAANTTYTNQAVAYTASVAASAEATAQVAQSNGLAGSGSIPSIGDPPPPPGYQVP